VAAVQVLFGLVGFASAFGAPSFIPSLFLALGTFGLALGALWLIAGSRGEARAFYLGAFFVLMASAPAHPLGGLLLAHVDVPIGLTVLVNALLAETFFPLALWLFVRHFPRFVRVSTFSKTVRRGTTLALVAAVGCLLANLAAVLARPAAPPEAPLFGLLAREHPAALYWLPLFALTLGALVTALLRRREAAETERRRVTLFMCALALGVVPTIAIGVLDLFGGAVTHMMDDPHGRLALSAVSYAGIVSLPFTTAYAIRAHRVLDIRVVLHRAAQRLLLRSTVLAATATLLGFLCFYLYLNRAATLASLLSGPRGRVLVGLLAASALLVALRDPLLRTFDRILFGGAARPDGDMARATSLVAAAGDSETLARALAVAAKCTLGADHAVALVHQSTPGAFVPVVESVAHLPDSSGLVAVARDHHELIRLGPADRGSIFALLPELERHWVVDGGFEALLPVHGIGGELNVILAVGPRADGLPYSREDEQVLSALGSTAALAVETTALRRGLELGGSAGGMVAGECPTCLRVGPRPGFGCPCGGTTVPAAIPFELHGKFRLERVSGRGAMGVVYCAEDMVLRRPVALKTLPRVTAGLSARLRVEAETMAAVGHPHLVTIYGAETWRGTLVLVMEYLAGGTLTSRLGRPQPADEVMALGEKLADALQAMHAQGLLHRDIKPSNIGFRADGHPKLLDFGLARLVEEARAGSMPSRATPGSLPRALDGDLTATSHLVGTPLYMPPEVRGGQPATPASDVWSLGLVLGEALLGTHPLIRGLTATWDPTTGPLDVRMAQPACPPLLAAALADATNPISDRRPTASGLAARLRAARDAQA
jgi:serine/threonine-protein kinase